MHKNSGRSLAVRVGALTAALSLMLAGGVAMASSASASGTTDKNTAPGQQSASNTPEPGGSTTNPNGGAIHGDNGKSPNPNNGSANGGNGSTLDGQGGTGHVGVQICHATRSANNPYVFLTADFSSVDEAILWVQGGQSGKATSGNGHGDHVGEIWDGQRSGINWGDIISAVVGKDAEGKDFVYYPGYNLDAISVKLDPNGVGISGRDYLKGGCKPPKTSEITGCYTLSSANPAAFGTQTFSGNVGDESNWVNSQGQKLSDFTASSDPKNTDPTIGCGSYVCVDGVNGTNQPGNKCNPPGVTASANPSAPICRVVNGKYNGKGSVTLDAPVEKSGPNAQADADAEANAKLLVKINAEATGDNIIPPYSTFAGYNWNDKTQARFNDGNCSEVLSVISAVPLPATVAPAAGKPAPAKTPTKATLPASVPAGDGSSLPGLPLWALAMVVAGAIGAAAAGKTLVSNRK